MVSVEKLAIQSKCRRIQGTMVIACGRLEKIIFDEKMKVIPAFHLAERIVERNIDPGDVIMVTKWFCLQHNKSKLEFGKYVCRFKNLMMVFEIFEKTENSSLDSIRIMTSFTRDTNENPSNVKRTYEITVKDLMATSV